MLVGSSKHKLIAVEFAFLGQKEQPQEYGIIMRSNHSHRTLSLVSKRKYS